MDKSKLGALGILFVVGIGLYLSKAQDAPAPPGDPDDAQMDAGKEAAKPANAPTKADPALAGGITKLQIQDEQAGTGPAAQSGDSLSMNYKGSLLNGEVFDTSYGKAPFDFTLGTGNVIKGWDQGIVGMKVGGKRKLTIPSDLGYGAQGSPPKIPGGATLVFEVELLKISKKSG